LSFRKLRTVTNGVCLRKIESYFQTAVSKFSEGEIHRHHKSVEKPIMKKAPALSFLGGERKVAGASSDKHYLL
jgi:hypothetical protein